MKSRKPKHLKLIFLWALFPEQAISAFLRVPPKRKVALPMV